MADPVQVKQAAIDRAVAAGHVAVEELKAQGLTDEEITALWMEMNGLTYEDLPNSCGSDA